MLKIVIINNNLITSVKSMDTFDNLFFLVNRNIYTFFVGFLLKTFTADIRYLNILFLKINFHV